MASKKTVRVRRLHEAPARDDGARVLVDRVWPRGMTKEKAHLDEWCKQVAPSTNLRKWYSHDPERFAEFSLRYRTELEDPVHADALEHLRDLLTHRSTGGALRQFSRASVRRVASVLVWSPSSGVCTMQDSARRRLSS